jgi:hypothetical protein
MADETTQAGYTTVQLRKDLHKRIRYLQLERDTDVRTEIENAVILYLQQAASTGTNAPTPQPVQP